MEECWRGGFAPALAVTNLAGDPEREISRNVPFSKLPQELFDPEAVPN